PCHPKALVFHFTPPSCSRRLLHAFPTRRSSDLLTGGSEDVVERSRVDGPGHRDAFGAYGDVLGLGGRVLRVGVIAVLIVLSEKRDRKSTRLNSSHVSI